MTEQKPFWQTKTLEQMTSQEWESLCDGCGRCCLHKLEDEDTDEIYFTDVACHYLDEETCACPHYEDRQTYVPDCLTIKPNWGKKFNWLPSTCAYRLLYEGKDLFSWHPLLVTIKIVCIWRVFRCVDVHTETTKLAKINYLNT